MDHNDKDPASNAVLLHHENLSKLVSAVTRQALDELHLLREQVDELIGAINECQESVEDDLREFAEQAKSALATKAVMADALSRLRAQFANPPMLPVVHNLPALEKGNGKDND